MNINRELIDAQLLKYSDALDDRGWKRTQEPTPSPIKITTPKIYKHSPTEDIRFNDVTHCCLTKEKDISEANELSFGDNKYLIKFVNSDGRLTELFIVKK